MSFLPFQDGMSPDDFLAQDEMMQLVQPRQTRASTGGGGVAQALAQALRQSEQDSLYSSPYFMFGQGLRDNSADLGSAFQDKPWLGKIVSALAGGIGTGLQQRGMREARETSRPLIKRAFELAQDPQGAEKAYNDPYFRNSGLGDALLGQQLQYAQAGRDSAAKRQEAIDKLRGELSVKKEFGELQSQIEEKKNKKSIPSFPNFGSPNLGGGSPATPDAGPKFGVPSIKDLERQYYQENVMSGMPEIQAATSAKAAAEDARKRSMTLFGKPLEDERARLGQIEELIRIGQEGMSKAGRTGSGLASAYEKAASWLPWATEAKDQAAGDALLSAAQNLGISINRVKGTGALSDFESKALMNTAMSPTQTNSQNKALLKNYEIVRDQLRDHQDFMNYFMDQTGGNPQKAQMMWDSYKRENPVVLEDGSINTARTPWQQFDFQGAMQRFATGQPAPQQYQQVPAPQAGPQQPQGQIIERTLKNGQTVKVRDIGGGKYELVQ